MSVHEKFSVLAVMWSTQNGGYDLDALVKRCEDKIPTDKIGQAVNRSFCENNELVSQTTLGNNAAIQVAIFAFNQTVIPASI